VSKPDLEQDVRQVRLRRPGFDSMAPARQATMVRPGAERIDG
jgi:hypothetical protein